MAFKINTSNLSFKNSIYLFIGVIILICMYVFYLIKCIYTCFRSIFDIKEYIEFVEDDGMEFIDTLKHVSSNLFKKNNNNL